MCHYMCGYPIRELSTCTLRHLVTSECSVLLQGEAESQALYLPYNSGLNMELRLHEMCCYDMRGREELHSKTCGRLSASIGVSCPGHLFEKEWFRVYPAESAVSMWI